MNYNNLLKMSDSYLDRVSTVFTRDDGGEYIIDEFEKKFSKPIAKDLFVNIFRKFIGDYDKRLSFLWPSIIGIGDRLLNWHDKITEARENGNSEKAVLGMWHSLHGDFNKLLRFALKADGRVTTDPISIEILSLYEDKPIEWLNLAAILDGLDKPLEKVANGSLIWDDQAFGLSKEFRKALRDRNEDPEGFFEHIQEKINGFIRIKDNKKYLVNPRGDTKQFNSSSDSSNQNGGDGGDSFGGGGRERRNNLPEFGGGGDRPDEPSLIEGVIRDRKDDTMGDERMLVGEIGGGDNRAIIAKANILTDRRLHMFAKVISRKVGLNIDTSAYTGFDDDDEEGANKIFNDSRNFKVLNIDKNKLTVFIEEMAPDVYDQYRRDMEKMRIEIDAARYKVDEYEAQARDVKQGLLGFVRSNIRVLNDDASLAQLVFEISNWKTRKLRIGNEDVVVSVGRSDSIVSKLFSLVDPSINTEIAFREFGEAYPNILKFIYGNKVPDKVLKDAVKVFIAPIIFSNESPDAMVARIQAIDPSFTILPGSNADTIMLAIGAYIKKIHPSLDAVFASLFSGNWSTDEFAAQVKGMYEQITKTKAPKSIRMIYQGLVETYKAKLETARIELEDNVLESQKSIDDLKKVIKDRDITITDRDKRLLAIRKEADEIVAKERDKIQSDISRLKSDAEVLSEMDKRRIEDMTRIKVTDELNAKWEAEFNRKEAENNEEKKKIIDQFNRAKKDIDEKYMKIITDNEKQIELLEHEIRDIKNKQHKANRVALEDKIKLDQLEQEISRFVNQREEIAREVERERQNTRLAIAAKNASDEEVQRWKQEYIAKFDIERAKVREEIRQAMMNEFNPQLENAASIIENYRLVNIRDSQTIADLNSQLQATISKRNEIEKTAIQLEGRLQALGDGFNNREVDFESKLQSEVSRRQLVESELVELRSLKNDLLSAQRRTTDMEMQLRDLGEEHQRVLREKSDLLQHNLRLVTSNSADEKNEFIISNLKDDIRREQENFQLRIAEYERKYNQLKEIKSIADVELSQTKDNYQEALRKYNSSLEEVREEANRARLMYDQLNTKLTSIQKEAINKDSMIRDLKNKLLERHAVEQDMEAINIGRVNVERELELSKSQLLEATKKIQQYDSMIKELNVKKEMVSVKFQTDVDRLSHELALKDQEIKETGRESRNLRITLKNKEKEIEKMRSEQSLNTLKLNVKKVRTKIDKMNEAIMQGKNVRELPDIEVIDENEQFFDAESGPLLGKRARTDSISVVSDIQSIRNELNQVVSNPIVFEKAQFLPLQQHVPSEQEVDAMKKTINTISNEVIPSQDRLLGNLVTAELYKNNSSASATRIVDTSLLVAKESENITALVFQNPFAYPDNMDVFNDMQIARSSLLSFDPIILAGESFLKVKVLETFSQVSINWINIIQYALVKELSSNFFFDAPSSVDEADKIIKANIPLLNSDFYVAAGKVTASKAKSSYILGGNLSTNTSDMLQMAGLTFCFSVAKILLNMAIAQKQRSIDPSPISIAIRTESAKVIKCLTHLASLSSDSIYDQGSEVKKGIKYILSIVYRGVLPNEIRKNYEFQIEATSNKLSQLRATISKRPLPNSDMNEEFKSSDLIIRPGEIPEFVKDVAKSNFSKQFEADSQGKIRKIYGRFSEEYDQVSDSRRLNPTDNDFGRLTPS